MINLIEKEALESEDHLIFSSYLLLQDRIEEAYKVFKKVSSSDFSSSETCMIQYDYLSAYFDILLGYEDGFPIARKLSKKYADYAVITWRMRFSEIADQLDEFDGKEVANMEDIDLTDIDKKQENEKKLKKLEPSLEFKVEGKEITVDYANVESVNVKYYIVNPEILFTREPFEMKDTEMFSYVKPVFRKIEILPPGSKSFKFKIDKKFTDKNILIELDCGKKKAFKTYFPCSLKALTLNYTELKVVDTSDNPIPRVYIKAFSKSTNGEIKFYKDGYTDMRGKFEYGFTNTDKLPNIQKLSILVFSEKHGSLIKEAKLPTIQVKDADIGFLNQRHQQRYIASLANNPPVKSFKGKKSIMKKSKKF